VSAESRARLRDLLAGEAPDIVEANLLVAVEAYPDLDVRAYLRRVDALAEEVARRGGGVNQVLATLRDAGLRGDRAGYDDPRNSFLNEVLDRGRGLPIALSALAVGVGARVGAPIAGVGLPGHFVVADLSGEEPRYVDPFGGWREISRADCARLARETAGVELRPGDLAPVDVRAMLVRMLMNLRGSYLARTRLADALWTVEIALVARPGDGPLTRDLVVLLAGLGRYAAAEAEARAYLSSHPGSPERAALVRQLAAIADIRRSMN
jgi:regulator of sirC expression with transglutaminase-like and TPR domain